MTEFVGAEYLIAKMLIEKHEPEISTIELNKLGVCIRRLSIEEGVGAVFLTSREEVYSAVFDYSDYFEGIYDEEVERPAKNGVSFNIKINLLS